MWLKCHVCMLQMPQTNTITYERTYVSVFVDNFLSCTGNSIIINYRSQFFFLLPPSLSLYIFFFSFLVNSSLYSITHFSFYFSSSIWRWICSSYYYYIYIFVTCCILVSTICVLLINADAASACCLYLLSAILLACISLYLPSPFLCRTLFTQKRV